MVTLVLTAIGDDRAGLVRSLADVVADHGGNWEQSQMTELAGKFAGIVLVTVPEESVGALTAALDALHGVLDVHAEVGSDHPAVTDRFVVEVLGNDRPGIVRDVTRVLAEAGASIDSLVTDTRDAPMAGGLLFEARAMIHLPAGSNPDVVRSGLETLAQELMVDVDLAPVT